ncbi:LysR family transcriptional regulator [Telluria mixta]|uniref:LysR family transcriptional regulator n=1 Tax=Telluria mixta TaxID=34071 RepID=A0ABT2C3B1_9BURK|nr:LysR family transcriptional regulator [Telluria mixta]MCS0631821.1 LysR family transcriptional regulator [Telluria mixta]WEM95492.1 LysR family transcriptional regulator [Telluria mixta]
MEHLDSFIYSAEDGGFSAAARRLGMTPAGVSKNVARLEANLGVRLFRRSTRKLSLTEEGEQLLREVAEPWHRIQDAMAVVRQGANHAVGPLRVAMAPAVGRMHFVPMLAEFRRRYPEVLPDLHFDNRQVDLIAEGFDVAIGGGVELPQGVVARELARVRILLAASPEYLARRGTPTHPDDLAAHDGIARRSIRTGRLQTLTLRDEAGKVAPYDPRPVAVLDDPEAMAHAAAAGLGVALLPAPHAGPLLADGRLVRILPDWYAETGPLFLYYSNRRLLPAKTRVFVDFVVERFREQGLAAHFAG